MTNQQSDEGVGKANSEAAPDIGFVCIEGLPNPFDDLICRARGAGLAVRPIPLPQDERWTELSADDWAHWAPFAVLLLGPAWTDAWRWLMENRQALWALFLDPQNARITDGPPLPSASPLERDYHMSFSLYGEFRHGLVRLAFPRGCSEGSADRACGAFRRLMRAYSDGAPFDGIELDSEPDCYDGQTVLALDDETGRLRVLNPYSDVLPEEVNALRRLEQLRRVRSETGRIRRRVEPWVGPPGKPGGDGGPVPSAARRSGDPD